MTRRAATPWIVLAVSLLLTAAATLAVADSTRARDRERFTNAVQSTRGRIDARLETYAALLRGGAGLFAASDVPIKRADFHEYTARLNIQERYPGIQGIGFSQHFRPGDQDSLVAAMRAQGFQDFHVWPEVSGAERHTILYLEPLDQRNRAAIGYDMFTEPIRQAAMARARDTGASTMSGKVTLVQEIKGRKQAGFLIYTPVYRGGGVPETVAARRAALLGFVYAPFRADDLFADLFSTEERPGAAFRIYDGVQVGPEHLLHDSRTGGNAPVDSPTFTDSTTLEIGGRTWTITFSSTRFFEAGSRRSFVPVLALAGLALSVILFSLSRAQVRAEEAVRGSEQRLRTVLESLPVGVFVADRTGQVILSNAMSHQIWAGGDHVSLDQYGTYKGWWAGSGRRIESHEWALARALRGEAVEGEIIDIEAFDGTRKTILNAAFPLKDAGGKVDLAVAAVVDVTEQRRAEASLRDREREFRTMVDSIPQLAWMADEAGEVFWYNQRWYDYTGTTLEEMKGSGWQAIHHPEYLGPVTDRFRDRIARGQFWEDTFPLRGKDGGYRWFLSRAVPIHDEAGRLIRWFGTNTDITEQLQAREAEARAIREQVAREAAEAREVQLRLHTAELERSNRELQDFAYIASHDLQEPLRKISSFADLLRMKYGQQLAEDGTHFLDRMQQAALRMSTLIRDLLAFSRVEAKARPFGQVDLNEVLSDVLVDLEVRLQETGGRVETSDLPVLHADATQMRQVFLNLIGNALKFHRPGTPPIVQVRGTLGTTRRPVDGKEQQVCRITVQDNGIGFEEKYLDRIFTPFQRLHTSDEYEGTGIGLAICRRIIERHGGTIEARSTPGDGSAFTLTLPIS